MPANDIVTRRMARLCEATEPPLAALLKSFAARAEKHPDAAAAPALVASARLLLGQAGRVLARRPVGPHLLAVPDHPSNADLQALLTLASAALAEFRAANQYYEPELGTIWGDLH